MSLPLRVDTLTTGYGRIEVIHRVTLTVPAGTVVALLGANGAGKTTMLRSISGTLPPWEGSIRLGRTRLDGKAPYAIARRGLTLIPEGRGVFPGLTVADHLAVAERAAKGDAADRTAAVLEMFEPLRSRLAQRAGTLSGGEQQMLALSRALIVRPPTLLLDEISMGLAPIVVDRLYEGVAQLKSLETTILLVEQYLTHALRVADLCYVLTKGHVSFVGEPGELRGAAGMSYLSPA